MVHEAGSYCSILIRGKGMSGTEELNGVERNTWESVATGHSCFKNVFLITPRLSSNESVPHDVHLEFGKMSMVSLGLRSIYRVKELMRKSWKLGELVLNSIENILLSAVADLQIEKDRILIE